MIKAVIFDYDDTICLTEESSFILENKIAVEMGFSPMTREIHQKTWGKPIMDAAPERLPGVDIDEFMRREALAISQAVQDGLIDEIPRQNVEILEKIKKSGKKMGIVTSRDFHEARHLLDKSHLFSNLMEAFYHKGNSKYFKPDPRVFDEILSNFSVKPEESVYVGDSLSDAAAANGAGIKFIAVLESGLRIQDSFKDYKVDFFVSKFTDILDYILGN